MPPVKPLILDGIKIREFNPLTDTLGGADKDYVEETIQFDTSSTSYVDVLTGNFTVGADGDYMLQALVVWNTTLSNKQIGFRLLVDTVPGLELIVEANGSSSVIRAVETMFRKFTLTEGAHEFKIQVKTETNPQSVSIYHSAMSLERWE